MPLPWKNIGSIEQLDAIREESFTAPVIIFKHSTRCNISAMMMSRFERSYRQIKNEKYYYLDLLSHRDISAKIAEKFHVYHESPQVLLIQNGECVYENSHNGISFSELSEMLNN